jgi:hypothetical protein
MLARSTESSVQINLANYVEQCWVANYNSKRDKDLDNTLWAYGELGLQVWFSFSSDSQLQPTKLMSRDKYLEFDLEVYPVGFISQLGVIVGVTQEIVHNACSEFPCFELNIRVRQFIS